MKIDLFGTYLCDQETEICQLQTLEPGGALLVDDEADPEIAGDFTITWIDRVARRATHGASRPRPPPSLAC